jgi:pimeloyl-ACP methyl ester carboxylesterase
MYDHLPEIDTPALLVWGNQDRITPPEVGRTFVERMPRARLFFIDQCGHAPNIEKPDELNAASEEFLKEIGY